VLLPAFSDIKSLNILLSRDRAVAKVADLGVSRQVSNATAFLTTFYGTPLYASPELCRGSPYDEKTDLWSLGVVLYEMATLQPPFGAPSLMGLGDVIKAGR
jgi:NIMA (never in mitosis gene a)-related kinase